MNSVRIEGEKEDKKMGIVDDFGELDYKDKSMRVATNNNPERIVAVNVSELTRNILQAVS